MEQLLSNEVNILNSNEIKYTRKNWLNMEGSSTV